MAYEWVLPEGGHLLRCHAALHSALPCAFVWSPFSNSHRSHRSKRLAGEWLSWGPPLPGSLSNRGSCHGSPSLGPTPSIIGLHLLCWQADVANSDILGRCRAHSKLLSFISSHDGCPVCCWPEQGHCHPLFGLKVLCFARLPRAVDSHDSVTIRVSLCPLPEVRVYDLYLALN